MNQMKTKRKNHLNKGGFFIALNGEESVNVFFVLISINLVFYILSGLSIYKGEMTQAIIFGVVALLLSFSIYIIYRKKSKSRFDCTDCSEIGDCDCNGPDCSP